MTLVLLNIFQVMLLLAAAPLLAGLVKRLKCRLQNRKGPSIFQPYRDLYKLSKKDLVVAKNASTLFYLTPYFNFSIIATAGALLPCFFIPTPLSGIADIIVFVGILGLARFFLALAGLDIGTAFGGMGASREMLIATIAEPALLMAFLAIAIICSSTNFSSIILYLTNHQLLSEPSTIFVAFGFALIALAETGRIPIDNPATHLELTMIHEAMVLEYSGRHLALIEWTAQIKLLLFCVLFINLFVPWGIATGTDPFTIISAIFWLIVKLIVLCSALVIAEINLAKLRLFRAPYLLNFAFLFCLLGLLIHITLEV